MPTLRDLGQCQAEAFKASAVTSLDTFLQAKQTPPPVSHEGSSDCWRKRLPPCEQTSAELSPHCASLKQP